MKIPPLVRNGFSQGMKPSVDPSVVPVDALWSGVNVRANDSGILRVRTGAGKVGPYMDGDLQALDTGFGKIIKVCNKNVYAMTKAGIETQIGTNIMPDERKSAKYIRWARDGAEIGYLFTGAGIHQTNGLVTLLGTPYAPQSGEQINLILKDGAQDKNSGPARCNLAILRASLGQRLALAGDPQSPNTVYLSAPLNAMYFPLNQTIQLPDDGGKIVGLSNWYNALVIWRDTDFWAFFGSDTTDASAALVLQDSSTGCVNGETIVAVPGAGMWFLGTDHNVYMIEGVSGVENQIKPRAVGNDVQKELKKAMSTGISKANAIYHEQEYRLFLPESKERYRVFSMRFGQGAGWYMDTGPRITKSVRLDDELYGSKLGTGQLVKFNNEIADDDETYLPELLFRREDLQPGPSRIKKVFIYIISKGTEQNAPIFFMSDSFNEKPFGVGESITANVAMGTDQNLKVSMMCDGTELEIKDFTLVNEKMSFVDLEKSEPIRIYQAKFKYHPLANFVQIRMYGTVPGEDIAIVGYSIEYSPRGRIHANQKGVTT